MNKKSVKKNYIYNMLYQLLVIILPIITTPYLARKLGAEGNGIFGYTSSIVAYFILFGTLGISMYGNREIAYNQKNKQKYSNVFWNLIIIKSVIMILSICVFLCFFAISGQYCLYYRILILELLGNLFDIVWFYQGLEDFKKIVIRNFIIKIISVVLIFVFIKSYDDLWRYFIITTLSTLIGSLSLWIGLKKYIVKPDQIEIKKHIKSILLLFIPQVAIQVYTVLDKTMIGSILNDMSEVGYYEQSQKITKLLLTIITSLGTVMIPRMASTYKDGNYDKLNIYMKKTINFVWILGCAITFGVIAVAPEFVPMFFGPGYEPVVQLLSVFSFLILAIGINNVIGIQYLIPTKKENIFTLSVVLAAAINFTLNLILINFMGTLGVALSSVIAETSIIFIQSWCIRKEVDVKYFAKIGIKYVVFGIIMLCSTAFLSMLISNNLICLITKVIVGCVVYFLLLIISKDKFVLENIFPILNKFKNKLIKKV